MAKHIKIGELFTYTSTTRDEGIYYTAFTNIKPIYEKRGAYNHMTIPVEDWIKIKGELQGYPVDDLLSLFSKSNQIHRCFVLDHSVLKLFHEMLSLYKEINPNVEPNLMSQDTKELTLGFLEWMYERIDYTLTNCANPAISIS